VPFFGSGADIEIGLRLNNSHNKIVGDFVFIGHIPHRFSDLNFIVLLPVLVQGDADAVDFFALLPPRPLGLASSRLILSTGAFFPSE